MRVGPIGMKGLKSAALDKQEHFGKKSLLEDSTGTVLLDFLFIDQMLLGFVTICSSTGSESSCCGITNTKLCTKKALRTCAHSLIHLCDWPDISLGQMPVSGEEYALLGVFTLLQAVLSS